MIKNILLGILGLVVIVVAVAGYLAYSKFKAVQNSFEVAAESPLIDITERVMEEGGRIVEGQTTEVAKLYSLHDEYLQTFSKEIEVIIDLQEKSDRELCNKFDAKELTISRDAIKEELEYLRTIPTTSDEEWTAFVVVLGSVQIQLPLVTTSVTSAKGFCAG